MRIVAGIDGGGTHTTLEIRRTDGIILKRKEFGPFNINSIGRGLFSDLVTDIFTVIKAEGKCDSICIGAAGISNKETKDLICEKAAELGFSGTLLLKGDNEIALFGANAGNPGGILIAGTGSICTGMTEDGRIIRVGGYGHLIDDVGSGYAIGRDALAAIVREEDGRGEKTCLSEMVRQKWGITDIPQLIQKIYTATDKSLIASVAREVEIADGLGDKVAGEIIRKAVGELTELVRALFIRMQIPEPELALAGGLLIHDTAVRKGLIANINEHLPSVKCHAPVYDAASGAAMLALRG